MNEWIKDRHIHMSTTNYSVLKIYIFTLYKCFVLKIVIFTFVQVFCVKDSHIHIVQVFCVKDSHIHFCTSLLC